MINLTHQIVHIAGLIAIFGFGLSIACSGERIEACKRFIQPFEGATGTSPEMCKALTSVIKCFDREISTCPASYKGILEKASKTLVIAEKECHNPGSAIDELGDVESCDADKFQACANKFKMDAQSASGPVESCRILGDARKCIEDFKKGCKSEYFVSLVDSQSDLIDEQEQICRQNGFSVDGTSSGSKDDSSNDSKDDSSSGSSNNAQVNIHNNDKSRDENRKQEYGSHNNNNNNNNDDGGGCGSVQPMFLTLLASGAAILVYSRLFL